MLSRAVRLSYSRCISMCSTIGTFTPGWHESILAAAVVLHYFHLWWLPQRVPWVNAPFILNALYFPSCCFPCAVQSKSTFQIIFTVMHVFLVLLPNLDPPLWLPRPPCSQFMDSDSPNAPGIHHQPNNYFRLHTFLNIQLHQAQPLSAMILTKRSNEIHAASHPIHHQLSVGDKNAAGAYLIQPQLHPAN